METVEYFVKELTGYDAYGQTQIINHYAQQGYRLVCVDQGYAYFVRESGMYIVEGLKDATNNPIRRFTRSLGF